MSDAAGSVGAIVAGIALLSGGWLWLDPLVSIMIGILIFISSLSVVRQSFHILLEGAPPDIDCEVIREVLNQQDEIEEAHDIHAWMIGSNEMMLTAHFVPTVGYSSQSALESAKQAVQEHFDIRHVTFQVESSRCSVSHD